jgi:hypothetical protein
MFYANLLYKMPIIDSPQVYIAIFNDKTYDEWMQSDKTKLHHNSKILTPAKGSIAILYKTGKKGGIIGFAMFKGTQQYHSLLDYDVYSGNDTIYNRYEFPIGWYVLLKEPVNARAFTKKCGEMNYVICPRKSMSMIHNDVIRNYLMNNIRNMMYDSCLV